MNKNEIKYLKSLSMKKNRLENKQFIIEGSRIMKELLASSHPIEKIWTTNNFIVNNNVIKEKLKNYNYNIIEDKIFCQILDSQHPQGIMALLPICNNQIKINKENILVLDGISDPGNMGTILRSAAWFGIKNIICSPECVDIYNPKSVRSGMGAHFYLSININKDFQAYFDSILDIKSKGGSIIGTSIDGIPYKDFVYNKSNWAMVLGSEANGISSKIQKLIDQEISIPQNGKIESLNVGVAGSILLDRLINQ